MEAAQGERRLDNAFEQLRFAQDVIRVEADALLQVAARLNGEFCDAVDLVHRCAGSIIVTGMGKAGLIGQKIVSTLASTGTRSHFLHPAEAVHGDLGRIEGRDVVLALSMSGDTEELVRLLPSFQKACLKLIAITGNRRSALARAAAIVLELGPFREACPLGLAPSTSTTAMLAVGDALALVVSRLRGFSVDDFARFHPGGSLGRKLAKVDEMMRPLRECRVARQMQTVRQMLVAIDRPDRRRTGAAMILDDQDRLVGIFTDSDLARLLERQCDAALDAPVSQVMTRSPRSVIAGTLMPAAIDLLVEHKISELPVTNREQKPLGLIDITDVLPWLPQPAVPRSEAVEEACWESPRDILPLKDSLSKG